MIGKFTVRSTLPESQSMTSLIAIAVNLAGMLLIHCLMAHFLARIAWHRRGMAAVIVLIVISQLLWIVPASIGLNERNFDVVVAYTIWSGNWLVTGFGVVLLRQRTAVVPRQLQDTARLDGLGMFGTWWNVIFPFVARTLTLIAVFTVMATALPFWNFVRLPAETSLTGLGNLPPHVGFMLFCSILGALPLIGVCFLAKRRH
jgi:multiple sugar transport system permease protein